MCHYDICHVDMRCCWFSCTNCVCANCDAVGVRDTSLDTCMATICVLRWFVNSFCMFFICGCSHFWFPSKKSLCQAHLQYLIHVRSCAACYKRLSIPAMQHLCLFLVVDVHCFEFNRLALPMQCRAFAIMQSNNKTTHCPNRA